MIPRSQHFGDRAPFPCRLVGYNADIREARFRSSLPHRWRPRPLRRGAAECKHRAGSSRPARRRTGHSRRPRPRWIGRASNMPLVDAFETAAQDDGALARARDGELGPGSAAARAGSWRGSGGHRRQRRSRRQGRRSAAPSPPRRRPACRRPYDACRSHGRGYCAVIERPFAFAPRAAGETHAERTREHLRVKREDGSAERHGRAPYRKRNLRAMPGIGRRMDDNTPSIAW